MKPVLGKPHFQALTSLRFFAAMHVLAFHNHLEVLTNSPPAIRNIIRAGYVSVSLFFVLSGFILAHTYLSEREDPAFDRRSFWIARVARIYPVYLLGLLLAAPFVIEAHFYSDRPAWSALKILVMGGSCCTLTQSWVPPLAVAWNGPGWSLSAEAFFYLLFPFVAPLIWKLNKPRTLIALAGFWLLSLVPPLLCWFVPVPGFSNCPANMPPSPGWVAKLVAFNPLLRLPEFLLGIALGRLFFLERQTRNKSQLSKDRLLSCAALARIMLLVALTGISGLLVCGDRIPYAFLHNGLLDIFFAVLIFGLARGASLGGRLPILRMLSLPVFVLLGEASYAIYILHVPLRNWMYRILDWIHPGVQPSLPLLLVYTLFTLAISILVFKVIEEPARRLIRRRFAPVVRLNTSRAIA
jgi:peptidoglycan/LPS O-acetylase OafA/YrhL